MSRCSAEAGERLHRPYHLRVPLTACTLVLLALFHVVTLRTGYGWGDDFAMYIHHAKNIAEGLPYAATGYVYNPHNPGIGPAVYPPGYPLLLAPIYKLAGINVQLMRLQLVVLLIADLALVAALFWEQMSPLLLVCMLAIIGLNPSLWSLREEILSDIPFLLFCLAAILLMRRVERHPQRAQPHPTVLLLGLACYLAFATRTVGLLLLVSLALSDLWVHRRLTRVTGISLVVFAVLATLQRVLFGSIESYLDQLVLAPVGLAQVVVLNVKDYVLTLVSLWGTDPKDPLATVLTIMVAAFAAVGLTKHARHNRGVLVTFPLLYTAVLLIWPNFQGIRFVLPLLPFYLFYVVHGMDILTRATLRQLRPLFALVTVGIVGFFYANFYMHAYYGPIGDGVFAKSSAEMFEVVKSRTSTDDVVVFFKPRALALFTDRRSSAYYSPWLQPELLAYFRGIGSRFVVVGPQDTDWSERYILSDPTHFSSVWSNSDFTLFQARLDL